MILGKFGHISAKLGKMKTDQSNVLLNFDHDLPSAGTNGWSKSKFSSFHLHYYKKL